MGGHLGRIISGEEPRSLGPHRATPTEGFREHVGKDLGECLPRSRWPQDIGEVSPE